MIPLSWYLLLSAALFSIGLFGVLARRNAIVILMGIDRRLNAANINLLAFWRYLPPDRSVGLVGAIFLLTVAAAEAAAGLALIISVYRNRESINADELDLLKN